MLITYKTYTELSYILLDHCWLSFKQDCQCVHVLVEEMRCDRLKQESLQLLRDHSKLTLQLDEPIAQGKASSAGIDSRR